MTFDELKLNIIDNGYWDVQLLNNLAYTSAFVGISSENRAIYDFDLMVDYLINEENMEELEAMEFIEYNVIKSLEYYKTPPIIKYSLK